MKDIWLIWAATEKLSYVYRNRSMPINNKKVFNTCILQMLTYRMQTVTITIRFANEHKTMWRAIARMSNRPRIHGAEPKCIGLTMLKIKWQRPTFRSELWRATRSRDYITSNKYLFFTISSFPNNTGTTLNVKWTKLLAGNQNR